MRYLAGSRLLATVVFAFAASMLTGCGDGKDSTPIHVGGYPILFVTQVPVSGFNSRSSAFGNHLPTIHSAPRGGDLYLRYPDGTLRNLTKEAGFGMDGEQGANAIAVRDPSVHWSGTKAVFSMVVGATTKQHDAAAPWHWQLFEVEGFEQGGTAKITPVSGQPVDYDNISPTYGSDDRILFTSDRPRDGSAHLFPQLDEYESRETVTGLWSLDPASGDLFLLNHTASGVFTPTVDSIGRVIFTKWDHLQRDQQADADRYDHAGYGTFNFGSESASATKLATPQEVFPEPDDKRDAQPGGAPSHNFNQFFPWQINQDGMGEETVNHVGRHEFGGTYSDPSIPGDPNLTYSYATPEADHANRFYVGGSGGFFQIREDPAHPGTFYATNAQEFETDCAGGILKFTGASELNGDQMVVTPVTAPVTRVYNEDGTSPDPDHSGHYRNPLPLLDGTLIVAHTDETRKDWDDGTPGNPALRYSFRLKTTKSAGQYMVADQPLTAGIEKSITYWDPDNLISFSGPLWELDPVEVRPQVRPPPRVETLGDPEAKVLSEESVDEGALRKWLIAQNLALIVTRNVTSRDRADLQQPFNLRVPGGAQTIGKPGAIYDVTGLQFYQGDQVRAYADRAGRRVLAQPLHDGQLIGPAATGQRPGSIAVALDGSTAAFVPARRALTWALTGADGSAVVRERNWLSFAPGEIRTCASCHGVNTADQAGGLAPENPPEALRTLIQTWKELPTGE